LVRLILEPAAAAAAAVVADCAGTGRLESQVENMRRAARHSDLAKF